MTGDRPLLGIGLMVAFCAIIPMGDALLKILGTQIPVLQILLARFGMQAILPTLLCWRRFPAVPRDTRLWALMAWRALLHLTGVGLMVLALIHLPLADAVAIAFVMPFLMLLLGWWFLSETIGPRRLIACGVGFCGTLMVVQPAFQEVGAPALLPLLVAVSFALFMLSTRQLARRVDPLVLQSINGAMATSVLLLAWALPVLPEATRDLVPITAETGWMLLAAGIIGTGSHYLMTLSLNFVPASTVAPIQYLEIPFATLIGWLVWQDLPNGLAGLGILVTIGSGLYVIQRERIAARAAALAHSGPPA